MLKHRKITANSIFPVVGPPIVNGILVVDNFGTIVDLIDRHDDFSETEGLEHYNGIICPGFVNAHCHLELSHLKGKTVNCSGLPDFLFQIFMNREADYETIIKAARQADLFMYKNGIVAVGDITNSSDTLEVKEKSRLYYHSFIEVFGFHPQRAPRAMEYAEFVSRLFQTSKLVYSVTPHSPYSTSSELFEMIGENSIYMNAFHSHWLNHNRSTSNTFLVTCPKSNLYIEKQLPNFNLLKNSGFRICVGTDSLASNNSLSVIDELKTIQHYEPSLSLNELLEWACINGAAALGVEEWAGSFEKGKKPGVNLIAGIDLKTMKLTDRSTVKKLA